MLTRESNLSSVERQKAMADARVGVATFLLAVGAVGSLFFTAQTFRLSQSGQVTERYSRAIELLGSASVDVRIGAIFALERISLDSPHDQPTIVEVLCAFVREHSELTSSGIDEPPTADVVAAVSVVGRRRFNVRVR
jgi:hypothetical protein